MKSNDFDDDDDDELEQDTVQKQMGKRNCINRN